MARFVLYSQPQWTVPTIAVRTLANSHRRHLAVSPTRRLGPAWDRWCDRHVVEARTGVPLAAVLVRVQSTGQQAFSDADGRFEIVGVPSGPQVVLVSVVGFGLVRRDVAVGAGEAVDVRINSDIIESATLFAGVHPHASRLAPRLHHS